MFVGNRGEVLSREGSWRLLSGSCWPIHPTYLHPPPLSQRRAVRGMPAFQHHRPAPLLPGDPDRPALPGAERRQRGGHGRLDAVLLSGCLQRGELGTGPEHGCFSPLPCPEPLWYCQKEQECLAGWSRQLYPEPGEFPHRRTHAPQGDGAPSYQVLPPLPTPHR